ncbi:Mitochondrial carrier family protein [Candida parapsilosis]|nr:Mitochondrial carrier family protein [Candida parapsilosis]
MGDDCYIQSKNSQCQEVYSMIPIRGFVYNDTGKMGVEDSALEHKRSNQAVSVLTAGIRAIAYQIQSLYLRSPVKLFRPSRFDYLAYVRALANQHNNINEKPYKFRTHSSIGMLISVIRKEGWKFIPDQVMPPLIANSATGIILYATYLNTLDRLTSKRETVHNAEFHWYSPIDTWRAGFVAGVVQSLAAAPVDAIYTRSSVSEMIEGSHQNLWQFGINKLKEIGLVGVFAGYSFSLIKESFGFAFYFSTFETIKTQGYTITFKVFEFLRIKRKRSRESYSQFSIGMRSRLTKKCSD